MLFAMKTNDPDTASWSAAQPTSIIKGSSACWTLLQQADITKVGLATETVP